MNAANYVGVIDGKSSRFGIGGKAALIADLRALADGIEAERIEVHGIETSEVATHDGFPASSVRLSFCRYRNDPAA